MLRAPQSCSLSEIHDMALREREEAHLLDKLKRKWYTIVYGTTEVERTSRGRSESALVS